MCIYNDYTQAFFHKKSLSVYVCTFSRLCMSVLSSFYFNINSSLSVACLLPTLYGLGHSAALMPLYIIAL